MFYHSVTLLDDVLNMLQGLSKCLGVEGAVCGSLQNPFLRYLQPPTTFRCRRDVCISVDKREDRSFTAISPFPFFLFSGSICPGFVRSRFLAASTQFHSGFGNIDFKAYLNDAIAFSVLIFLIFLRTFSSEYLHTSIHTVCYPSLSPFKTFSLAGS